MSLFEHFVKACEPLFGGQDPDPHQGGKSDPDPHQRKIRIRIRIRVINRNRIRIHVMRIHNTASCETLLRYPA